MLIKRKECHEKSIISAIILWSIDYSVVNGTLMKNVTVEEVNKIFQYNIFLGSYCKRVSPVHDIYWTYALFMLLTRKKFLIFI